MPNDVKTETKNIEITICELFYDENEYSTNIGIFEVLTSNSIIEEK